MRGSQNFFMKLVKDLFYIMITIELLIILLYHNSKQTMSFQFDDMKNIKNQFSKSLLFGWLWRKNHFFSNHVRIFATAIVVIFIFLVKNLFRSSLNFTDFPTEVMLISSTTEHNSIYNHENSK